jgi:hypothetical protein
MKSITVKGKVVNGGEVETQFTGKNLTPIGGIKLFDKFARKLGVRAEMGAKPMARISLAGGVQGEQRL